MDSDEAISVSLETKRIDVSQFPGGDTTTIEQQQEAIREGLALTLYGEFRGTFDRDSISRQNAFGDADRVPKYLTEQGAVPHHELTSRYATCICYPLIEKK